MPSLKDIIAALQVGWFPALAAFICCSIIVLGDHFKVPYLDATPRIVLTSAIVGGVFSFSILAARIAYVPIEIWRAVQRSKAKKKFRKKLHREILNAPDKEKIILAYQVTSGRKVFTAEYIDSRLIPLVTKGLIVKLGGTNSILEWPYMVHDEVWDFLVEHRDQFHFDIPNEKYDPFH